MNCLIVGGGGQLGLALQANPPAGCYVTAPSRKDLDLTDTDQVARWLERVRPDVVFNTAAYTAVDKAEDEPEKALLINSTSVQWLAKAVARYGSRLVHVSTDFVFDGDSSRPYCPEDFTNPLNAYGLSKLDGEMKVRSVDAAALIVRTSWLYAAKGKNFVNTMLRLLSERDEVRVVMDQIGTPTYARNLAQALWVLAGCEAVGTYHYSDEGVASWYDFAVAVSEEALEAGLFRKSARVIPVTTANYPTSAKRPRFSVLEKSKTRNALGDVGQHWRAALREMLKEACLDE